MTSPQPVRFLGRAERHLPETRGEDKALEPDDPYELVGVRVPLPDGVDADRAVARCMVEDYALMGWGRERIRQLFAAEEFQGAHDIVVRRGPGLLEELLDEVFGAADERKRERD